jgi:hypothetical protein
MDDKLQPSLFELIAGKISALLLVAGVGLSVVYASHDLENKYPPLGVLLPAVVAAAFVWFVAKRINSRKKNALRKAPSR